MKPPAAAFSADEFDAFTAYFHGRTGIHFTGSKRYFVDRRLLERMHQTGTRTLADYLALLPKSPTEEERLINLLTINETYFFREDYQFRCMVHSLLPEITSRLRPGARLRIWSLPCSTGEEPYSIALYLLEHYPGVDAYEIEILASDIDTGVLTAAQAGLYDERSLQRMPAALRQRYFNRAGEGRWRILDSIRESVCFTQLNAADPQAMRAYTGIDLIFCRNMLIYFDDRSRLAVVQRFYDSLNPGGFICLGHSESMNRITALFQYRAFSDASVYQKPLAPNRALDLAPQAEPGRFPAPKRTLEAK